MSTQEEPDLRIGVGDINEVQALVNPASLGCLNVLPLTRGPPRGQRVLHWVSLRSPLITIQPPYSYPGQGGAREESDLRAPLQPRICSRAALELGPGD